MNSVALPNKTPYQNTKSLDLNLNTIEGTVPGDQIWFVPRSQLDGGAAVAKHVEIPRECVHYPCYEVEARIIANYLIEISRKEGIGNRDK
ncbi:MULTISPECIES: hypothetical protein [Okeania]|uniref:Uncharacterized protein n=1 Tax=Okeania hirsuta TaxID=1458930 RepID=A0A3N6RB14_9CYAN|nr:MULTISPECIES: hypothetical protein [Okeania]NES75866.1 hypothetical protein [Okeania sp. SIO1H4]NES91621.1 hypothetical protein [Okeania sp. SIO2B9]NET19003.1 hypothetical protein [Okeania sp. SIO1H5]NET77985.1 hypothetical protein [Okeania sp. SIO1F9]NET96114.1 hypothetical protein [Okeania sp. SIO1H2]